METTVLVPFIISVLFKVAFNVPHELRIEDYLLSIEQSDTAFL